MGLVTIEVCNEFRLEPKTWFAEDITAELYYTFPDGDVFKLPRGAWLSRGNRISLSVNDSAPLIIACSERRHPPEIRIFTEEYGEPRPAIDFDRIDRIMGTLEADHDYPIEVRLISELRGEHYATFNYVLAIATVQGQSPLSVELVKASDRDMFQQERKQATKAQPNTS